MKRMAIIVIIIVLTVGLANATIREMERKNFSTAENARAGVSSVCVDGYKFVYAYGWATAGSARGVGAGGSISIIQVYEEKDGKVVPAQCM